MKKFVIGVCVGLLLLGGIPVSANLNGSPHESLNVVQVETEVSTVVEGVVLFEREDGTTIEGVLYAGDLRDGPGTDGPGADSLGADGSGSKDIDDEGHNGG